MNSLARILARHGGELVREAQLVAAGTALTYHGISLEPKTYEIGVVHEFEDAHGKKIYLIGEPLHIDELAARYPDCEVGY